MDIIYITYQNIGPFRGDPITIDYKKGKYLIKAPIGSGKSFLFFDGLVFGLYKYNQRNILNRKSENGFVKILIKVDDNYYLVIRNIKATKSGGETVQSRLFNIDNNGKSINFNLTKVINNSIDIQDFIDDKIKFEEIIFKSNTELQNALESLIPSKEVFLSTNFLMQDSDNIFELTPADRINVFKNIFGLINIDAAKDQISDKKREIQLQIKLKSDTENFDLKIKDYIGKIDNLYRLILNIELNNELKEILNNFFDNYFFNDISLLKDKININDFSMIGLDNLIIDKIKLFINAEKEQRLTFKSNYDNINKNLNGLIQDNKTIQNDNKQKQIEIDSIQSKISNFDENKIKILKNKKNELRNINEKMFSEIDKSFFEKSLLNYADFHDIKNIIDSKINKGKTLKSELDKFVLESNNLLEQKNDLEKKLIDYELHKGSKYDNILQDKIKSKQKEIESEIQKLIYEKENINNIIVQSKNIEKKISEIDNDMISESSFICDKIGGINCPYIDVFKKDSLNKFKNQKNVLISEKMQLFLGGNIEQLLKHIETINQKILLFESKKEQIELNPRDYLLDFFQMIDDEKNEVIKLIENSNFEKKINDLEKKQLFIKNNISEIKLFLENINWKEINLNYDLFKKNEKTIFEIDKEISLLEGEFEKILELKNSLISLNEKIKLNNEQINKNNKTINDLSQELDNLKNIISSNNIEMLKKIEIYFNEIIQNIENINNLVLEYKNSLILVNKYKEDEKILNDLYNIFSKELMWIILQEFLPSLFDIVNNYLSQIVDYTIKHDLIKRGNDKLELEIQIEDEKGLRPVKSLSGGQKTVLKLIWILAVSSLMKVKFLALDETINNLDFETIGKVADVLQNYVKGMDMKFFVVTHSRQIQEMNIWDEEITFDELLVD